jgi:hypothetical protein
LSWFGQQEIRPTSWLRTQIGARMDNFWYDVNQIGEVTEPISGEGSATIVNPKLNLSSRRSTTIMSPKGPIYFSISAAAITVTTPGFSSRIPTRKFPVSGAASSAPSHVF